jgi:hypothetical protein
MKLSGILLFQMKGLLRRAAKYEHWSDVYSDNLLHPMISVLILIDCRTTHVIQLQAYQLLAVIVHV